MLLYDARFRSIAIQAFTLLGVAAGIAYLATNAVTNLQALGLASGFGFLGQVAGFDISFSLLPYDRTSSTYFDVLLVGIANTLAVSFLAIIVASLLGFLIGIFQLAGNWPLLKLCRAYIEIARNIPLLLQLLFWYTMALVALPHQRESLSLLDMVFLNVRGLYVPQALREAAFLPFAGAVLLAIVAWRLMATASNRRRERTGRGFRGHVFGLLALFVLPALAVAAFGTPVTWSYPVLTGFNYAGGFWLPPEFVALLTGLSLYTAAFIAEIVRGGIQAISKGQSEAATALGLSNWKTMRLVIIPQALRIIIPPLTSQYLNVIKNSSLAVAIAYPDIVSVFTGTSLNQTGRAIEIVAITMAFYLAISLTVSAFMNWYNRRVALVGRSSQ